MSAQRLAIVGILALTTGDVSAEEKLPKNLTLQCSGEITTMEFFPARDRSPRWDKGRFDITAHLKDNVLTNLSGNELLGKDCFIAKGEIGCTFDETKFIAHLNLTERNQGIVLISRDTGAAKWLHDHFVFGGNTAAGRPNARRQIERNGTCQTVKGPKPIF